MDIARLTQRRGAALYPVMYLHTRLRQRGDGEILQFVAGRVQAIGMLLRRAYVRAEMNPGARFLHELRTAIDRSLANKVSYPFVWGVIVLTLVWPVVSYLIRALAYLAGNVAMALGDEKPLYTWDPATMQVITSSLSQPVYTIVIAAAIMTVAGLLLWMSPVIAYQISMGKVYEGVSTTVSGWVGALVGAGVELYSAQMAAAIHNQAERVQAQGTYAAEVTRAEAGLDAGNLGVRARQVTAIQFNSEPRRRPATFSQPRD